MIAYIKSFEKIKLKNKIFNLIEKTKEDNMFILPISNKTKENKIKKISFNLCKIFENYNIKNVILSNNLINQKILKETLQENRVNILNGSKLYKILLCDILVTICKYKNVSLEKQKISILTDESDELVLNNIIEISQRIKNLTIITNNASRFQKIVNYLYEEQGIIVRVSNNLNNDLLNSDIIINMDFVENKINKYNINTKAIILNIPQDIIIKQKKFVGININSYNIIIPEEYKKNGFNDTFIYEGLIYNKTWKEAVNLIQKDNVKIKNFIGINGIINKEEFLIN